ncbi:MAG: TetR/AcrR family transcriptional regulator [Kiritimatiellae bacterium]|nr:TetR/AcrR family transcriptional regulator [Kiritimatiellia bacterium]
MINIHVGRNSQAGTKTHLLDVAERLFADCGLATVSIRDITEAAKTSLGAINYHFGTKWGLIAAVFDRRLTPVTRARLAALDAVEKSAGKRRPSVEDILRAFIVPAFSKEGEDRNTTFRKLMGRCMAEPSPEIEKIFHGQFQTLARRFDSALLRARPDLDREEVFWRMSSVIAVLHHALLMVEKAQPLPPKITIDEGCVMERLVIYGAAIMCAPLPGKPSNR